ncbi:hypothetical protein HK096_000916 [Nowakowskiella sp. JEL0078]|nr:hypothetical protein HK096_000916 [Nowakowskiella sp. JEL0078]
MPKSTDPIVNVSVNTLESDIVDSEPEDLVGTSSLVRTLEAQLEGKSHCDINDDNLKSRAMLKLSAIHKFRHGAKMVMRAQKFVKSSGPQKATRVIGGAAGIDFLRMYPTSELIAIKSDPIILVSDYDSINVETKSVAKSDFADFLKIPRSSFSNVRWISIQGLDFDVMKSLNCVHHIHPLVLEDIYHDSLRVKTDFHDSHIYVSLLMLLVGIENSNKNSKDILTTMSNGLFNPLSELQPSQTLNVEPELLMESSRFKTTNIEHKLSNRTEKIANWVSKDQMEILQRLDLNIAQANFILMKDGV